jgi:hypothetical protein
VTELDEWMRMIDEGRCLEWTGELVKSPGTAMVPRRILSALRVGRWYWVGCPCLVDTGATESWYFPLDEVASVRGKLARAHGAEKLTTGEPCPARLVDPLLATTHAYALSIGNGYQATTITVSRADDGTFERSETNSIYDGMGASSTESATLDLDGALAAVEDAFRQGFYPDIRSRD